MLPFVGYILLFFVHCALPQPLEFHNSPAVTNFDTGDYTKYHALNLLKQSFKRKQSPRRKETAPTPFPSGYVDFTGCEENNISKLAAYKFHNNKKTWDKARLTCYREGGHLAFPECPEEGTKYQNILNRVNSGGAWIGMHDMYEEEEWLTVFDNNVSDLKYKNWAENEPDNAGPNGENCGELGEDGLWYDSACSKKLNFFCKIDF